VKYRVWFTVYASTAVEVDAENEEEARQKAEEVVYRPSLCHQCSDELEMGDVGDIFEVEEIEEVQ
jgi:hypothetical protein